MANKANFNLITELQTLTRRDFPVAKALSAPFGSNPLLDGEFLELDANGMLKRGGDGSAASADEGTMPLVFPVHTERGRTDVQAISKVNVLYFGEYEAETEIVDTTGLTFGAALTVQDISIGGEVKRGLKLAGATANRVVVGYVSKLLGTGKVRFVHFHNIKVP